MDVGDRVDDGVVSRPVETPRRLHLVTRTRRGSRTIRVGGGSQDIPVTSTWGVVVPVEGDLYTHSDDGEGLRTGHTRPVPYALPGPVKVE